VARPDRKSFRRRRRDGSVVISAKKASHVSVVSTQGRVQFPAASLAPALRLSIARPATTSGVDCHDRGDKPASLDLKLTKARISPRSSRTRVDPQRSRTDAESAAHGCHQLHTSERILTRNTPPRRCSTSQADGAVFEQQLPQKPQIRAEAREINRFCPSRQGRGLFPSINRSRASRATSQTCRGERRRHTRVITSTTCLS